MSNEGTPVKHVSSGGRSLAREHITVGHTDVPLRFYRTDAPTIFAGFTVNWIEGHSPDGTVEFDLNCGAGLGSKYMTLRVKIADHDPIYEYVDITEVLQSRIEAIVAEVEGA